MLERQAQRSSQRSALSIQLCGTAATIREGQRQIDAIHCHPVQLALPSIPNPPHHTVGYCAYVHVVAILHRGRHSNGSFGKRQRIGKGELVSSAISSPADGSQTVALKVESESTCKWYLLQCCPSGEVYLLAQELRTRHDSWWYRLESHRTGTFRPQHVWYYSFYCVHWIGALGP